MTSSETARQLGYAAFPVVLLAVAAFIGWRMGKKRQPQRFVFWPVALAAALLVLGMLGNQLRGTTETPPAGETR